MPGERPTHGECKRCGKLVSLTTIGRVRPHGPRGRCPGSGLPPKHPEPTKGGPTDG